MEADPVHPTKPHLKPKKIWPRNRPQRTCCPASAPHPLYPSSPAPNGALCCAVVPDFDNWGGSYVLAQFDSSLASELHRGPGPPSADAHGACGSFCSAAHRAACLISLHIMRKAWGVCHRTVTLCCTTLHGIAPLCTAGQADRAGLAAAPVFLKGFSFTLPPPAGAPPGTQGKPLPLFALLSAPPPLLGCVPPVSCLLPTQQGCCSP